MKNIRKFAISSLLLAFAITASAQFKVHLSGKATVITTSTPSNNANLTVGSTNNIVPNGENINLHACMLNYDNKTNVGINGVVLPNGSCSPVSIGVRGIGRGGDYGRCYGVLGNLHSYDYGAGIFGGIDSPDGVNVAGKYAGYFYGPVYSTSYITAATFVTTSDKRLKENIIAFGVDDEESTLDKVLKMNVVKYNYKEKDDKGIVCCTENKNDEKKIHIGLLAQELKEIYPELVCEQQNGYYGINYTELVPVLVRSIQELKQEINELKNGFDSKLLSPSSDAFGNDETADAALSTNAPAVIAKLAQNMPNPFTERTTIRFSLPEGTQNAYIYIFDMTGKMQKQLPIDASMQSITINGYELSAGMYIYSLVVNGKEMDTKRMILSK